MLKQNKSPIAKAVFFHKPTLRERILKRLSDPLNLLDTLNLMSEAMELQDERVKPVQDYLAMRIYGKPYSDLSTPACRVVNAEINWNMIHQFSRELTLNEALIEGSKYREGE